MTTIPEKLQQIIRDSKGQPVRLADPKTNVEYVVLPAEIFDQMQSLLYDDTPLTYDEVRYLLVRAGMRAGWNDAEMDIYNELDPRRDHEGPTG